MPSPHALLGLYREGKNISALLREERGLTGNSEEVIEIAYDLQAGSYVESMKDPAMAEHKRRYAAELADTIRGLGKVETILEAGVGEATTLAGVLDALGRPIRAYGFDVSWSRVAVARQWLESLGHTSVTLCTGSLLAIPFATDSVDVVYTSHSIEPNGGKEAPILAELARVAREYLVLWEPSHAHASEAGKRRMEAHGYCRGLPEAAEALGLEVVEHRPLAESANPLNPTAVTVIRTGPSHGPTPPPLACPRFGTPLEEVGGMLFSPEGLVVYPVLGGIPCLREDNGVFASRYPEAIARHDAE